MKNYRKKPVVIQAIQLKDSASQTQIIDWARGNGTTIISDTEIRNCSASQPDGFDYPCLRIPTKEGEMTASVYDFVIRGVKGEFYPCKPDIFEATYEAVE